MLVANQVLTYWCFPTSQLDKEDVYAMTRVSMPVLIDQGEADNFLVEQLNTQLLIDTAKQANFPMQVRFQPGYDHSYFFIATLIEEHIVFHAKFLQ